MIILDATTEKLQMVLAGAITTNQLQYTSNYIEVNTTGTGSYTPMSEDGLSNNTTAVDIVGVPSSASVQRHVKYISVYNADTVAATVTINKDTSGTDKIFCKTTLQSGDTLQYVDGKGFSVISSMGGAKNTTTPSPLGIAAGASTDTYGTVILSNSNNVSFGMNGSTITASVRGLSLNFFEVGHAAYNPNAAATNSAAPNLSLQRVIIPYWITATRLDLLAHLTVAGKTNGTWSISAGVYTRTGSTLNSASTTASGVVFESGGNTTNTNSYSGISGTRHRTLAPQSWAFTPGEYWFGFINSVQGPAGTTGSVTIYGQSSNPIGGMAGGNNDIIGIYGIWSNATGAFPTSINVTDIWYAYTGAATASNLMRQPAFRLYGS